MIPNIFQSICLQNEGDTRVSPSPKGTGAPFTPLTPQAHTREAGDQFSGPCFALAQVVKLVRDPGNRISSFLSHSISFKPFVKVAPGLSNHNDTPHHLLFGPHLNPSCCSLNLWDRVMCWAKGHRERKDGFHL